MRQQRRCGVAPRQVQPEAAKRTGPPQVTKQPPLLGVCMAKVQRQQQRRQHRQPQHQKQPEEQEQLQSHKKEQGPQQ